MYKTHYIWVKIIIEDEKISFVTFLSEAILTFKSLWRMRDKLRGWHAGCANNGDWGGDAQPWCDPSTPVLWRENPQKLLDHSGPACACMQETLLQTKWKMKVSFLLTCTRVPILINKHAYAYTSIFHIQRTFQELIFFRMPFLTGLLSCFKIMFSICLIVLIKLCHFRKARSLNVSEK